MYSESRAFIFISVRLVTPGVFFFQWYVKEFVNVLENMRSAGTPSSFVYELSRFHDIMRDLKGTFECVHHFLRN